MYKKQGFYKQASKLSFIKSPVTAYYKDVDYTSNVHVPENGKTLKVTKNNLRYTVNDHQAEQLPYIPMTVTAYSELAPRKKRKMRYINAPKTKSDKSRIRDLETLSRTVNPVKKAPDIIEVLRALVNTSPAHKQQKWRDLLDKAVSNFPLHRQEIEDNLAELSSGKAEEILRLARMSKQSSNVHPVEAKAEMKEREEKKFEAEDILENMPEELNPLEPSQELLDYLLTLDPEQKQGLLEYDGALIDSIPEQKQGLLEYDSPLSSLQSSRRSSLMDEGKHDNLDRETIDTPVSSRRSSLVSSIESIKSDILTPLISRRSSLTSSLDTANTEYEFKDIEKDIDYIDQQIEELKLDELLEDTQQEINNMDQRLDDEYDDQMDQMDLNADRIRLLTNLINRNLLVSSLSSSLASSRRSSLSSNEVDQVIDILEEDDPTIEISKTDKNTIDLLKPSDIGDFLEHVGVSKDLIPWHNNLNNFRKAKRDRDALVNELKNTIERTQLSKHVLPSPISQPKKGVIKNTDEVLSTIAKVQKNKEMPKRKPPKRPTSEIIDDDSDYDSDQPIPVIIDTRQLSLMKQYNKAYEYAKMIGVNPTELTDDDLEQLGLDKLRKIFKNTKETKVAKVKEVNKALSMKPKENTRKTYMRNKDETDESYENYKRQELRRLKASIDTDLTEEELLLDIELKDLYINKDELVKALNVSQKKKPKNNKKMIEKLNNEIVLQDQINNMELKIEDATLKRNARLTKQGLTPKQIREGKLLPEQKKNKKQTKKEKAQEQKELDELMKNIEGLVTEKVKTPKQKVKPAVVKAVPQKAILRDNELDTEMKELIRLSKEHKKNKKAKKRGVNPLDISNSQLKKWGLTSLSTIKSRGNTRYKKEVNGYLDRTANKNEGAKLNEALMDLVK
tara:strand:- start:2735 stop:5440 length:2706 start_codon:yes stop_codon:yes gene_type:complete